MITGIDSDFIVAPFGRCTSPSLPHERRLPTAWREIRNRRPRGNAPAEEPKHRVRGPLQREPDAGPRCGHAAEVAHAVASANESEPVAGDGHAADEAEHGVCAPEKRADRAADEGRDQAALCRRTGKKRFADRGRGAEKV